VTRDWSSVSVVNLPVMTYSAFNSRHPLDNKFATLRVVINRLQVRVHQLENGDNKREITHSKLLIQ